MKVVVVGDALVSVDTLEDAVKQIVFDSNYDQTNLEIVKFEWFPDLSKDKFQEKILAIEKNGPENMLIPDGVLDALVDADCLFIHLAPVSSKMLSVTKKLKLIGTCRGGLEHINLDFLKGLDIDLFHVIRNAEPVADFTLGLMLAETRNIARSHYAIKNGGWPKNFVNDQYKTTLKNHIVGLLGVGYIGKLVAKRLEALNVRVIAYDPFITADQLLKEGLSVELHDLDYVLGNADIISLHMRLSEETKNIVNKSMLDKMKPSAYLINTARAGILDRDDLLDALQKKKIAGAALDVCWSEPIAADDPFLALDNITLTSHIAGDTIDSIPKAPYLLKDVLNAYFKQGFSNMKIKI